MYNKNHKQLLLKMCVNKSWRQGKNTHLEDLLQNLNSEETKFLFLFLNLTKQHSDYWFRFMIGVQGKDVTCSDSSPLTAYPLYSH